MARTAIGPKQELMLWQWNANGLQGKKASLQQYVGQLARRPDVILLQETHSEAPPTLPGYRSYASPPSARAVGKGAGQGVCTLVKKGITYIEHGLLGNSAIEHRAVEIVTGRRRKESTFVINVYSNPKHYQQKFRTLVHKVDQLARDNVVLVCGDFNAPHTAWGYPKTTVKGRNLFEETTDAGYQLLNDPAVHTRHGTSVQRDTNPDLAFCKTTDGRANVRWRNTGETLGSDHCILEIVVPLRSKAPTPRAQCITDWNAYREALSGVPERIDDIDEWTRALNEAARMATTEVELEDTTPQADSRLAHLLEARNSVHERWKRQRHNRKLRKRVAQLNREIEKHCAVLCRQQWHAVCQEADGQIHKSRTWQLLRHLLDESKTKGTQHHTLARTLHKAKQELGEPEVRRRLNNKYLPSTPPDPLPGYAGADNTRLDEDIEEWEIRAALQSINCRSAAGPDKATNKALRNLNDAGITALTRYYNECWRAGKLPKKWKDARTVLIPKPGKPPHIENMRPISLTSCVGKVLEHVLLTRWQSYLEDEGLYPDTMLGFRARLSTQDAMLLIKHEVIDQPTRSMDNRAVLGLDLQSAFDRVRHSAILEQVSRLNMGRRTFAYIKDFLTDRTTTIVAGDMELPSKTLGSVGTPQGSVISPILFNMVMIGVAERLAGLPDVKHTIYADDITLWTTDGSDGHIEAVLQQAIDEIESQLQGTGLVCSPAKSELLIIPPRGRSRSDATEPNINLRTRDGTAIPHVKTLRVLGLHIDALRHNGFTIKKLDAKVATAIRLIRKVSTRHAGMKEASLLRLVQSFAISHVAHVAAFHEWKAAERQKLDAIIRKAYKAALGLYTHTSTEKLLELGVHNTLDEIAEAQHTAQMARLAQTRTGRSILQRLGYRERGLHEDGGRASLPRRLLCQLQVPPIPKHMHPEVNQERRIARAKALTATHASDNGAYYVDVAKYPDRPGTYAAAVVAATSGELYTAGSVRARSSEQAEELAIALALTNPRCSTVISDSRSAIMNYATDRVSPCTVRVCGALQPRQMPATLKWFPAHVGPVSTGENRNEGADRAARALTSRGASPDTTPMETEDDEVTPLTSYKDTLEWYRGNRQVFPPPHHKLTRREAVTLRQLQTCAMWTPVIAKHVCPDVYPSDVCAVCRKDRATMAHILWNCKANDGATETLPPHLADAVASKDYDVQYRAVQQVLEALERQRPKALSPRGLGACR